jgi:integrase
LGTLYKKRGSKNYQMGICHRGVQICKSTGTSNRKLANDILTVLEAEAVRARFHLPSAKPPTFEDYSRTYLESKKHPNTQRQYRSSINNLLPHFGKWRLSDITAEAIEDYKLARLAEGIRTATINRDLAVLRNMLRIAERKRLIGESPFRTVEFLEERKERRKGHIMTFQEEDAILAVAEAHIRMLLVLAVETGLRTNKEALQLRWADVDLDHEIVHVNASKTPAGEREVPLSTRCKMELHRWREMFGPKFSPYIFPNMRQPLKPLKDVRRAWTKALELANVPYFWIYDLRHTWASRMVQAGVSPIFVAQMLGHSSTSILNIYAKAVDEYRRDAVRKLEALRSSSAIATPIQNVTTRIQ